MPKKRKSNLSQSSRKAKRQAAHRLAEAPEERQRRLEENAQRLAGHRAAETQEERQLRLYENAQRLAAHRAVETQEERQLRLSDQAHRQASLRVAETPEELQLRLEENAERLAAHRSAETPEERQLRLNENAQRLAAHRAVETQEERQLRLSDQAHRQASLRVAETPEELQLRLEENAERLAAHRSAETPEERQLRLNENAQRLAAHRAVETQEERQLRLSDQAHRQASLRVAETLEELQLRLEENAQRLAAHRSAETPEERQLRLNENAQRLAAHRAVETQEERQLRLSDQAHRQASLRVAETTEQNERRRQQHAVHMASQRATETAEEAEFRRNVIAARAAQRRQTFHRNTWGVFENAALEYDPTLDYSSHVLIKVGRMDTECRYCRALKWKEEPVGMCCAGGKVAIHRPQEPVQPMKELFLGETNESKRFLKNIRRYNTCFHMTSFGADTIVNMPGFSPTFTIKGQVYHKIGSLLPAPNMQPNFLQIYFYGDEEAETDRRFEIVPGVEKPTLRKVQTVLHEHNNLIKEFKTAIEVMPDESCKLIIHPDRVPHGQHERRYNLPTINEVAAIVVGNDHSTSRDIVLHARDDKLSRVADTHRFYDALQYPIIFWNGQEGYHFDIPQINPLTRQPLPNKKVSCMDFYAFQIMVCANEFNLLLRCNKLLHQFLVDMYVKIESERLRFISLNQKKLRAENYIHLQDAVRNDNNVNPNDLGQMVILPSTFVNSPRYLHEYTQDAFAYVRNYGRPDLFITFTCNPSWNEITDELMPGQKATDRHDLIARVFELKVKKLISLLTKGKVFGDCQCFMYSIEWQKRGLPHVHVLLWLKEKLRLNQMDDIISAEIPDPETDKKLYDAVLKHMIHGPCGNYNTSAPCMKDSKCTKTYPRALLDATQTNANGYPLYRRAAPEDGGRTATIRIRGGEEVVIDNSWIVPYNPLLLKMFTAHVNVEYCGSVQAIKYICKYINKGNDQAIFNVRQSDNVNIDSRDEVQSFRAGRYVSSNEAAWRILGFPMHERYPTVTHLAVHLPNGERVFFNDQNLHDRIATPPMTTLTAFFQLCQNDEFSKTLLYVEVPRYYIWNASAKEWKRRKQGKPVENWPGVKAADALGRIYTVHVSNFECYCLRMLLNQVRGPSSFHDLKTVGGQEHATFRKACEARGLLESDDHWDATMDEAVLCRSPAKVRELFAVIVSTCGLSNPLQLWDKYKVALSEDIAHRLQGTHIELIVNEALKLIENKITNLSGMKMTDFGLPTPEQRGELSSDVVRELNYDAFALDIFVHDMEPRLLPEQRHVYDVIIQHVNSSNGGLFFLDAPGGTGKTFVLNLLLARLRKDRNIALAVASSGIAATLLNGGRTAHSTFKLPLNLASQETPTCNISKNSNRGALLQQCKLIVWDECTMSHKHALEALNFSLQDIRSNQSLMGGVVVLLAGDFRQTLPVIERGTPVDEMNACLKASQLWSKVIKLQLTCNMRVQLFNDLESGAYASKLLKIGEGLLKTDTDGKIEFTNDFCHPVTTEDELIAHVYPNIQRNISNEEWLCERAVLSPTNESVNNINKHILAMLAGESKIYTSIDTVMSSDDSPTYPVEFLNSLELTGVPSHKLELKVGVPVLLMRNLDAPRLCNGTRLRVTELGRNIVHATILTGTAKGESVLIPRIPIIPNNLPFHLLLAENNKSYNVVYRNVLL
ncbi:uncharacterized protein LOC128989005 [Macrosteles quadrilineatus]|uniref:uncharacterized protein LOC128989005 n=1 Tax=Macrosteles quadrilineatus TaxID=74068 RepID=UPI0023E101A2|nr:uncharacterized protein LOC128989005 [Macrosteles quadrilineatus]